MASNGSPKFVTPAVRQADPSLQGSLASQSTLLKFWAGSRLSKKMDSNQEQYLLTTTYT